MKKTFPFILSTAVVLAFFIAGCSSVEEKKEEPKQEVKEVKQEPKKEDKQKAKPKEKASAGKTSKPQNDSDTYYMLNDYEKSHVDEYYNKVNQDKKDRTKKVFGF